MSGKIFCLLQAFLKPIKLKRYYLTSLFILETVSLIYKIKDAYANTNRSARSSGDLALLKYTFRVYTIPKSILIKESVRTILFRDGFKGYVTE